MRNSAYYNRVRRNDTLILQAIVAGCRPDSMKAIVARAELARREDLRLLWRDFVGLLRDRVRLLAPFIAANLRIFWPTGMPSGQ